MRIKAAIVVVGLVGVALALAASALAKGLETIGKSPGHRESRDSS